MSMTIVVTRNVPDRFRGFLASVMLEVAPGVYLSPQMSRGVRDRVWHVLNDWACMLPAGGSVSLFWRETTAPAGLGIANLGSAKVELREHDGIWLDHRELTRDERRTLDGLADGTTTLSDK